VEIGVALGDALLVRITGVVEKVDEDVVLVAMTEIVGVPLTVVGNGRLLVDDAPHTPNWA
jgi:hypothetical protein